MIDGAVHMASNFFEQLVSNTIVGVRTEIITKFKESIENTVQATLLSCLRVRE